MMFGKRAAASVTLLLLALLAPADAPAAEFAGSPDGAQVGVFHPLGDVRRPVLAMLRARGVQSARSVLLAPPGVSDAQVAANAHGDTIAAWTDHEGPVIAVRDRDDDRFTRPQPLRPRGYASDVQLAINANGDAIVTFNTDKLPASRWRPAGRRFARPRAIPLGPFG